MNLCFQLTNPNMILTPKYLDYCALSFKIIHKNLVKDAANNILRDYFEVGNMIMKPEVLNDFKTLFELDKYSIAIYEADVEAFVQKPSIATDHYIKYACL